MAEVVGCAPLELPGLQRKDGLGAAQGLNLALLIHTKNQDIHRGTEVEPYDVSRTCLNQLRIFGENETLAAVRFESDGSPDATHRGLAQTEFLSHQAGSPVRGSLRGGLQGFGHDLFDRRRLVGEHRCAVHQRAHRLLGSDNVRAKVLP
jgi:hypothetical protein